MINKIIRIKQPEDVPDLCYGCIPNHWDSCCKFIDEMEEVGLVACQEEGRFDFIYVYNEDNNGDNK